MSPQEPKILKMGSTMRVIPFNDEDPEYFEDEKIPETTYTVFINSEYFHTILNEIMRDFNPFPVNTNYVIIVPSGGYVKSYFDFIANGKQFSGEY